MSLRVLYAVNAPLPDWDYRVVYGAMSTRCAVSYALPSRPASVPPDRFHRLDVGEGIGWRDVPAALRLAWLLVVHRRDIDVAHFYSTKLLLLGPVLARVAGTSAVITVTGFGRTFSSRAWPYAPLRLLYLALFRVAVMLSVAVLFQNTADLDSSAARLPGLRHKLSYVGSAVAAPILLDKDYDGPLVVLLVARVMPAKGIDDFLSAAHRLAGPEMRFVLVGGASPGNEELQGRVQAAHTADTIRYLGRLEGERLLEAYARAHVLCFPSRGEGMARVMIEAGFAGLCPVAYDIAGNRDLVVDGAGYLLPSGDREGIVRVLRSLRDDRARLRSSARAFQDHVAKNFNMATYCARMDAVMAGLHA